MVCFFLFFSLFGDAKKSEKMKKKMDVLFEVTGKGIKSHCFRQLYYKLSITYKTASPNAKNGTARCDRLLRKSMNLITSFMTLKRNYVFFEVAAEGLKASVNMFRCCR